MDHVKLLIMTTRNPGVYVRNDLVIFQRRYLRKEAAFDFGNGMGNVD